MTGVRPRRRLVGPGTREPAVALRPASWRTLVSLHAVQGDPLTPALRALAGVAWGDNVARCAALDEVVRAARALRPQATPKLLPHLDEILMAVRDEQQAIGIALELVRQAATPALAPTH